MSHEKLVKIEHIQRLGLKRPVQALIRFIYRSNPELTAPLPPLLPWRQHNNIGTFTHILVARVWSISIYSLMEFKFNTIFRIKCTHLSVPMTLEVAFNTSFSRRLFFYMRPLVLSLSRPLHSLRFNGNKSISVEFYLNTIVVKLLSFYVKLISYETSLSWTFSVIIYNFYVHRV